MRNGLELRRSKAPLALLAALALALALALPACGGGGDTETAGAGETAAQAESGGEEGGGEGGEESAADLVETDGVTDYVEYTGGEAGEADSSEPAVKIGWVNNEGGSVEPLGATSTTAAEFAVDYVNEKLGGIGGRPLELVVCPIRNAEEEGLGCAQKFLNDDDVSAVAYGGVSVGAETIGSTIGGKKPIVTGVSLSPSDATNPNTYILFGATQFTVYGWGSYADQVLDAKTAAVIYPEGPGLSEVAAAIQESTEAVGIDSKLVGFNPESGDLVGALTAAGAQNADMIAPIIVGDDCIAMDKAVKQLGIEPESVVGITQCTSPELLEAYGGDYPQWTFGITSSALGNNPPTPAGAAFREVLDEYGESDNVTDPWWPVTFSEILTIAQFLNQAAAESGDGEVTADGVTAQAEAFDGPLLLGAPDTRCGKYPVAPASCNDSDLFFRYAGDGNWTQASPWMPPPAELQEKLDATS